MKRLTILLLLLGLVLACPAFSEEAAPTAVPTPSPTPDSVAEGYIAPATPTPVPTPEPPQLRDDPMLLNVVEIAHRIDILAESKLFMQTYTYGMVTQEQIDAASYGSHVRPSRVFHLDGQTLIDALYAGADPSQMLDFTRPELRRDLVDELAEILWGRREDMEITLLSLLARFKIFALEGAEGCGLYILLYEEASPVAVTWVAEQGCVQMAAYFMPDEVLASADGAEAVSAWFAGVGMPAVTFEEVPLT